MLNIEKAKVQMFCENCKITHSGDYGSGRFCCVKCARGFSSKNKRSEINYKVSQKLSGRKLTETHKNNIQKATNFNRKEKVVRHCLECNAAMECSPSNTRKFCNPTCWITYTEKNKVPFLLYRQRCNFEFKVEDFPEKFDLQLVRQLGWYSPSNKGNNLNGVSRDHMLSVKEGFELGIDPSIIKHPANCKIMPHRLNQSKREKSTITLELLLERIKEWSK